MKINLSNKKAQIKMAESIGVLFIFFMLLILVMVFYTRLQAGKIIDEQEEQFIKKSIETSQIIEFLPELQCSRNNIIEDNCFDLFKVEALKNVMDEAFEGPESPERYYYFDQFGFTEITIKSIFPTEREVIVYDNPLEEWIGKSVINVPITVYDPIARVYSFGILKVATYR